MALRILVGCCIFGAACYAVHRWLPGLRQHNDVVVKSATLRSAPAAASAFENKIGKDKKNTDPEGTGVGESCSATQGNGAYADNRGEESFEHGDSIVLRLWSKTQILLSEHMVDTLVPPDMQSILHEAWEAVQSVEWVSYVGCDKFSMLFTSIFCILIAMNCWNSTTKNNTSEVEPSPAAPVDAMDIDWKSIFSISELARVDTGGNRHEGGYIYPKGIGARQLSKKDAAAAVIQRWVRHKFKPWLQRANSQSSTEELPSSHQRWIDENHGATVSTTLEDSVLHTDDLEPPGDEMIRCEDVLP